MAATSSNWDGTKSPYYADNKKLFNAFNDPQTEKSLQNEFQAHVATCATAILLFYTSGVYALGFLIAREAQSVFSQVKSLPKGNKPETPEIIQRAFSTTVFFSAITDKYSKEVARYIPDSVIEKVAAWTNAYDLPTACAAISAVSLGLLVVYHSKLALFSLATHDIYASLRGFHVMLARNQGALSDDKNDVAEITQNTIVFKCIASFKQGSKWGQTNVVERYAKAYFPAALPITDSGNETE